MGSIGGLAGDPGFLVVRPDKEAMPIARLKILRNF